MDTNRSRSWRRNAASALAGPALWVSAAALLAGCGGGAPTDAGAAAPAAPPARSAADPPSAAPSPPASPTPSADPGTLPQTHVLPRSDDAMFQDGVQALWRAIVADDPAEATPFFFPRTAYVQVKAIQNPLADYRDRLLGLYTLDIHAVHALLGAGAPRAEFVGVTVPTGQALWITPGTEYNKGSYYRVYGTRLTYRIDGKTKSFGVFSLISWRGEWYVVHLGPSVRSSPRGVVYAPEG